MTGLGRLARQATAVAGLAAVIAASASLGSQAVAGTVPNPNPDQVHPSVTYGKSDNGAPVKADIYSPTSETKPEPILIIAHGGGWNSGDKQGEAPYAASMASEGFVTVNVNYTLSSPKAPGYPNQVKEIQQAITWTIAHARQYGGDPNQIALVGFSAGGYLSAMAALLDSNLPGHPIKAVITLSAPFDFPVIQSMLRQRVAVCGYSPSCPQDKQDPPQDTLSAFATMYDFLGCPTGNCSSQLLRAASPVTHVTTSAPAFLMFNSSNELIPSSQATDMASVLQAAKVPEQVVIVPGSQHGEAYLPEVDGTVLKYLGERLGLPGLEHATNTTPGGSSGSLTILVVLCLVVVAGSVGVIAFVMRRRRVAEYRPPAEYRRPPTGTRYR